MYYERKEWGGRGGGTHRLLSQVQGMWNFLKIIKHFKPPGKTCTYYPYLMDTNTLPYSLLIAPLKIYIKVRKYS